MKINERLFEDFSRVASGAASTLSSLRDHIESRRPLSGAVSREEFEAVATMAAKARAAQEALEKRVAALEGKLRVKAAPAAKPQKKAAVKKKVAAK